MSSWFLCTVRRQKQKDQQHLGVVLQRSHGWNKWPTTISTNPHSGVPLYVVRGSVAGPLPMDSTPDGLAVQNEWGGRDSRQKSDQLMSDIIAYFTDTKDPYYIDDLEDILENAMLLSFNTEIEDGSIEEVAEQIVSMNEECLQGNYESVEQLRKLNTGVQAVSQSQQVSDENTNESSNEEASEMAVDEPQPNQSVGAEDGWSIVTSKRNRGKRSSRELLSPPIQNRARRYYSLARI